MVTRTEQRLKAGDDLIVWSEEAGPYNSEPEELWEKVRDEHTTAALFISTFQCVARNMRETHWENTGERTRVSPCSSCLPCLPCLPLTPETLRP